MEDVLSYVEFDVKQMRANFRETAEEAIREGLMTPSDRKEIMLSFDNGLRGYTYYER